jgi:hypothetical protein
MHANCGVAEVIGVEPGLLTHHEIEIRGESPAHSDAEAQRRESDLKHTGESQKAPPLRGARMERFSRGCLLQLRGIASRRGALLP